MILKYVCGSPCGINEKHDLNPQNSELKRNINGIHVYLYFLHEIHEKNILFYLIFFTLELLKKKKCQNYKFQNHLIFNSALSILMIN